MENFNAKEYRDNLAKDLKDIRKTDSEKAQEILSEAQETDEYKEAKKIHQENKLEQKELKEFEEKLKAEFLERVPKIQLKSEPLSKYEKEIIKLPKEVQEYLDSKNNGKGDFVEIEITGKSENTGQGMSYYNGFKITSNGKSVYESPLRRYRSGRSQDLDNWENALSEMKILSENLNILKFGYKDGNGGINIVNFDNKKNNIDTNRFDMREYEKSKESNNPSVIGFKKWIRNHAKNFGYYDTNLLSREIGFSDDKVEVVVLEKINKPYDASTESYQVFVWDKINNNVMINPKQYTGSESVDSTWSDIMHRSAKASFHIEDLGDGFYLDVYSYPGKPDKHNLDNKNPLGVNERIYKFDKSLERGVKKDFELPSIYNSRYFVDEGSRLEEYKETLTEKNNK